MSVFFLGFLIFSLCFLPSRGAADWMNQTLCLFQSPRCFIYRGKSTLTPLQGLWKIYQALSQLPHCLTWTVILEVQMCVVGQCNLSVFITPLLPPSYHHAHAVTWPALLSRHLRFSLINKRWRALSFYLVMRCCCLLEPLYKRMNEEQNFTPLFWLPGITWH